MEREQIIGPFKVDKYLPHVSVQNMAYFGLFIFIYKGVKILNEIGSLFRETREASGVSISEASKDLDIKEVILENIEDGNIGCFKDIFVLKDYIYSYSKYLGIDADKIIDEFNEYMFEYTSKIPTKEIEKKIEEQNNSKEEVEIISPYTKVKKKQNKYIFVLLYCIFILIACIVIILSIRTITISKEIAALSFVK